MNKINYEELAEKLLKIVEYEDRPYDICEELMMEHGRSYDGRLYHGSFGNTKEDVLNSYHGFVSCTYDLDVAEGFACHVSEDTFGAIFTFKMKDTFALDVQQLIQDCYSHCPDNELCQYLYNGFNGENEMLLYYDDIKDNIEFLNE